jgi:hypothetical protein
MTSYCSGVSVAFHSFSVFFTLSGMSCPPETKDVVLGASRPRRALTPLHPARLRKVAKEKMAILTLVRMVSPVFDKPYTISIH